jgi:hypothetical protein
MCQDGPIKTKEGRLRSLAKMEECRRVGTGQQATRFEFSRGDQIEFGEVKSMETTWKPHEKHGELTERSDLPDSVFAFPKQRKEPMTDASHVRNAIARFDQTIGVSDADRKLAFANIKKAAKHYVVDMSETDWTELGKHPSTHRTAKDRSKSAKKAAATRREKEHHHQRHK